MFLRNAAHQLSRTSNIPYAVARRAFAALPQFEDYGKNVFTGKVADEYLKKHGASGAILKDPTWVATHSDVVANAVFDWALDNGANVYCHWFQPMGASGVRHGQTGQVHNMMLQFNKDNEYYRRPDLQMTGRTVIGKDAPRGQELCDHYMAPLSTSTAALACMQEIQDECWRIGIPLKTRHREVAPNQFEFAPLYGTNTTQIDQNLMVMQIIEEVAVKHGLAALMQEKPFNGINGSGKHNNWSIATRDGVNLLDPDSLTKASGNSAAFPIVMAAIISAVDQHGDLMRAAISSPGNDFRLGACEAPPAIVSAYLGDDMTKYLEAFKNGSDVKYEPAKKTLDLGTREVVPFEVPAEDRNRTSPFPYGGSRFEFRAVGSSQNVSLVNTVLNTITAEKFAEFADKIEAGADPKQIAIDALNKHWKVIFNGNNYDLDNQQMLTDRGVWRIDSGVEAVKQLTSDKNVALFEKMSVLTKPELESRRDILHSHYTGTVEMEALTLIDMLNHHIIPAIKKAGVGPLKELQDAVPKLKAELAKIHAVEDGYEKAKLARVLRLETMVDIRDVCDDAEEVCPAEYWTLATYKELLFLDSHTHPSGPDYDDFDGKLSSLLRDN
ncbi:glutamine synthetase [Fistulifera solaris]|uniref:Glutamine synthetase n=1 Tax=Fistulifera solaris TaxID=1519565 RepID=A0A1Z5JI60_FISSO|nr:glutamine synthetase [Fistulifera solaris]|eukprot:GAX13695.1 glutamine synthetase [Fistulifera solaris]